MTIAVLCYDSAEVDIIRNVNVSEKNVENYIIEKLGYNPDNIGWMCSRYNIKINELTPEDFG